jgi:hypothetical protein
MKVTRAHFEFWQSKQKLPAALEQFRRPPSIDQLINAAAGYKWPGTHHGTNAVELLRLGASNARHRGATLPYLAYLAEYRPAGTCPARRVSLFKKYLRRLLEVRK